MNDQIAYESQMDNALRKFYDRTKNSGLCLWANLLKKKFAQIISAHKAKENKIYGGLMQIESLASQCEPSEASAKLIEKIQKIKGIVGVLCLSILCFNTIQFSFNGIRRVRRDDARVCCVRVVRKGVEEV